MTTSVIKLINELKSEIAALKVEQSPKIKEKPVKQPLNETIRRLPEVLKRIDLSRSAVYLKIKQGLFPKQIKLSERSCCSGLNPILVLSTVCAI